MEKMTVSMFAMLHGDDEALGETGTWEAETREELVARYVAFLRSTANDIAEAMLKPEDVERDAPNILSEVARRAYERGQRDERDLTDLGF